MTGPNGKPLILQEAAQVVLTGEKVALSKTTCCLAERLHQGAIRTDLPDELDCRNKVACGWFNTKPMCPDPSSPICVWAGGLLSPVFGGADR